MKNPNEFIWVEKYRPKLLADIILPKATLDMAEGYVAKGRIPNLLFCGGAGVGKTTLAKAMCAAVGVDYIVVNASNENSIDFLRTKITQFASSISFSEAKKVVILDEADNLTSAFQAAFRNAMEEFSSNCTFILTCNFPNRIIEPIHSRCGVVSFKISAEEAPTLQAKFFKRVAQILREEDVEFEKSAVAEMVKKHFPDFRRCLNELQKYSVVGKIDSGILIDLSNDEFERLIATLKNRKFNEMRQWAANNSDIDIGSFVEKLYSHASELMQPKSIPEFIIMLNAYQVNASQVVSQEINTVAFLAEVMMSEGIVWK